MCHLQGWTLKGLDFLKTEKFVYGLYQSLVFGGDKVSGQSIQCQVDGRILKDQESSYFYSKQNPDPGKSCEDYKKSRKCVGGQLTGLSAYHYNQCTDILENGKLVCNSDGVSAVEGAAGKFFSMQYVKSQSECDQYVLDVPCVRQKDHQAGFEFNQNQHFGECKPGAICKDPVDSNKVYQHGDVVIFSNIENPALGQECSSLNTIPRECYNGEFNKDATYKYSGTNPQSLIGGCVNSTGKSCDKNHINLLGQSETISIPNGQVVIYYKTAKCDQDKADFRCDEGVLKDSQGVTVQVNDLKESEYQYDQCVPEGKYCKYDSVQSENAVVTQWAKPSSADCSEKLEKSCLPGNLRPSFEGFPSLDCVPKGENLAKPSNTAVMNKVSCNYQSEGQLCPSESDGQIT